MDLAIHGLPHNGLTFMMGAINERGEVQPVDALATKLRGLRSYLRGETPDAWGQLPGQNLWQHLGGAAGRKVSVCVSVDHVSMSARWRARMSGST